VHDPSVGPAAARRPGGDGGRAARGERGRAPRAVCSGGPAGPLGRSRPGRRGVGGGRAGEVGRDNPYGARRTAAGLAAVARSHPSHRAFGGVGGRRWVGSPRAPPTPRSVRSAGPDARHLHGSAGARGGPLAGPRAHPAGTRESGGPSLGRRSLSRVGRLPLRRSRALTTLPGERPRGQGAEGPSVPPREASRGPRARSVWPRREESHPPATAAARTVRSAPVRPRRDGGPSADRRPPRSRAGCGAGRPGRPGRPARRRSRSGGWRAPAGCGGSGR
jgi:hypothetical protein